MPNWNHLVRARLAVLRLSPPRESDIVEELALHLEAAFEEARAEGLSAAEAEARAVNSYDWHLLECELSRTEPSFAVRSLPTEFIERRGGIRMESLLQDLRFGARMLTKQPGFTLIAVLTLALGIGANTAIFSIVSAVLLHDLPFAEAERLVMIWETHPDVPRAGASIPDFQDWRAQAHSFDEMAVHADRFRNAVLTGQGEAVFVQGSFISQNLFPLLGLRPVLGRNFLPEEEQVANNRVVILSHTLWQQRFGGDTGIVGKSIQLNGGSFTVIGVMGEQYPLAMDVWLPLTHLAADDFTHREHHRLSVIGRLKSGVTLEQARREMDTIAANLQQTYPASNKNIGVELTPLRHQLVGNLRPIVWLIFAAVALVLLIACANVSNLMLAQAAARQKEMALRAALGAGRGRLVRQLLSESLLLSLLGAAAGLALAKLALPLLRAGLSGLVTTKIPGFDAIGIDATALVFTVGISVLTGVLLGVLPALQVSRVDLNQALKESGKSSASVRQRHLSRTLVVAEVALAVVVLVGAGVLVRSMQRLLRVDPGFRTDHLLSLKINLPTTRYPNNEQGAAQINSFYQQLLPRLQSLPGVEQAAVIDRLPLGPSMAIEPFWVEGRQPEPGKNPLMQMRSVDQGFFELMRISLRSGRNFSAAEITSNPGNFVIVNETLARRFFPQQDAVGKRIFHHGPQREPMAFPIIGVVADIKDTGLDAPVEPEIYFSGVGREAVLLVRTSVEPLSLAAAVRRTVLSLDSTLPLPQARSVEGTLSATFARRRLTTSLLSGFGLLALALAAIGIYGVVAYAVTQRTQELGIRRALGAPTSDILKRVFGRGLAPVLLGVALGLIGVFALSKWLTSLTAGLLFEIRATDPLTFILVALSLLVVALLACWLPARRATKVDPLIALRHE